MVSGDLRKRLGLCNPLIGITTWGAIRGREALEVESADAINFGYMTRKAVIFRPIATADRPSLDENHSHFIFVDGKPFPFP